MNVNGTVVSVDLDATIQKFNGGGATYQGAQLAYRDDAGALKEQNFTTQALKYNPAIKNQLMQLTPNSRFTMVKEKEGDFWNVKGIYLEGAAPAQSASPNTTKAPAPSASPAPKSTYATAEERAATQVYIIKQSCISSAVNLAASLKLKNKEEVLDVAKFFEAHVLGQPFDDGTIHTLQSDDID